MKAIDEFLSQPITLEHYLLLSLAMFSIGAGGLIARKTNLINVLMSIELMLLSISISLISFSSVMRDGLGQVASLFIVTLAAAEAAIALAIIVVFYRLSGSVQLENINKLRG
jgi:NADH-quinone oxidoreductase subunit K